MRDTPWHARPRAPEPPSATQPAPQQTTFRRLVIVNQELAQHNAKVRPVSFPPDARGELPRHDPTGPDRTLLSYPQLRQDLADARRRATVAANAEAQAGIVVAMHREKQAEAARLRRELLVRDERKTRTFRLLSKHVSARRLSPRGRKKMVSLTSSRTRSSRLNLDQPGRGARGDPQAQDPGGRAGQSA